MKRTYRVFHLIKSLGRGGAETLLIEAQRYASKQYVYGYGYFLPWKDALVPSLKEANGEVFCFNCRGFTGMLSSVPRVSRFLRDWQADLVHCHLPLAAVVGRFASYIRGIPVIYTEHNVWERYHPWTRRVNRLTWKLQDQVIAVSSDVQASIYSSIGNSVPVTVLRNGIPVDSFVRISEDRKDIRSQWNIPDDSLVVGSVAVFRPQKDLQNWLRAARLIRDRMQNVQFLLVGDGVLMKDLRATASELSLDGIVHFAGLQSKVSSYLSAMDLFMTSSIFEGLPLALLEAMAMRLPVVATAVGGVPEVVVDGKTGLLIPPGAPDILADRVCMLLGNREMCREFGLAGRLVVEERFDMKKMVDQLEDIYLQILERQKIVD